MHLIPCYQHPHQVVACVITDEPTSDTQSPLFVLTILGIAQPVIKHITETYTLIMDGTTERYFHHPGLLAEL